MACTRVGISRFTVAVYLAVTTLSGAAHPEDQINALSPEEVAEGWQLLFDGVDMRHWHTNHWGRYSLRFSEHDFKGFSRDGHGAAFQTTTSLLPMARATANLKVVTDAMVRSVEVDEEGSV